MMNKEYIKISIKRVENVRQLQEETSLGWKRRMGQLYYQELEDGNFVPRVISDRTNGSWIQSMIASGKLWIPEEGCFCEKG